METTLLSIIPILAFLLGYYLGRNSKQNKDLNNQDKIIKVEIINTIDDEKYNKQLRKGFKSNDEDELPKSKRVSIVN